MRSSGGWRGSSPAALRRDAREEREQAQLQAEQRRRRRVQHAVDVQAGARDCSGAKYIAAVSDSAAPSSARPG